MRFVSFHVLSATLALLSPNLISQQEPGEGQLDRTVATGGTAGTENPVPSPNLTDATALPPTIVPIHTGTDEPEAPYGIWGAALPSYKASFHGDMTFIPYLGSDYPHNQPVSWHTQSVTVGNSVLMSDGEKPERHNTETRYEYRFGAVTEAYDLTLAGLEQSFVIHDKPAATGDLVVRGRIATRMTADAFTDAHRAIVWRDGDGTEIVRYGEAFTVDAAGHKEAIAASYDGEHVVLTVTASALQHATFPLVIDPLLTPVLLRTGGIVGTVDVCRNDSNDKLMMVHNRSASVGDTDAFVWITNDDFAAGVMVASDVTNSWSNSSVRCATAADPQKYCVALTRDGGTLPNSRIRFQVRAGTDLSTSSAWQQDIVTPTSRQEWRLDVGGTARYSSGRAHERFLIVWQRDDTWTLGGNTSTSTIQAVPLDVSGVTGVGGGTIGTVVEVPKAIAAGDAEFPSVNQEADNHTTSTGADPVWVVCWQEWSNSRTEQDWDVVARQVDANSTVSSTRFFSSGTRQRLGPQIAGRLGRYAVIYAAANTTQVPGKATGTNAHGIDLQRFDWVTGRSTIETFPVQRIRNSDLYTNRRWNVGGLAHDDFARSHWAYLYKSDISGYLYTGRVGRHGIVTERALSVLGIGTRMGADILGGITFDDDDDRWALVWSDYPGNVFGNHYLYTTPSAPPSTSGIGCSTASISWYGPGVDQQIGCEDTLVRLDGMPTGALSVVSIGFFTLSAALPSPPFVSGCHQNAEILLTTNLAIGSSAFFQMPLPEFLQPSDLFFQGYHTNAAGTQFLSTRRLKVPIVK